MKTLTIKQPWAELIASGDKRVENRGWRTHYRGRIAIHAGLDKKFCKQMNLSKDLIDYMSFGAIIARVSIVDCVAYDDEISHIKYPWLLEHEYSSGPWCWILEQPTRLITPVPVKGKLSFWEWKP